MPELHYIIRGIRQTEKGTRIAALHQYVLQVSPQASKGDIKQAVESLFNVSVRKINTQCYEGKWRRLTRQLGRRASWKKAIVTLAKGQTIELK